MSTNHARIGHSRAAVALVVIIFIANGPLAFATSTGVCHADPIAESAKPIIGDLALEQVLAAVRRASPATRIAALESVAAYHDAAQASRRNNPTLSVETENIVGNAPFGGFDAAESTFSMSQTFRLGNKRRLEARAAQARAALTDSGRLVVLRAAELEASRRFYEFAAAFAVAQSAETILELSETFGEAVARRVDVGKSRPADLARSRAATARARAAAATARANAAAGRYALSRLWGDSTPLFDAPSVELDAPVALPFDADPAVLIERHPQVAAAVAGEAARQAELRFSRSLAYPDLTVGVGVRRFEAAGEALVANISIPLPLFDRNQDAINAARVRIEGATTSAARVRLALTTELSQALVLAEGAESRRAALLDEALPAAESAERAIREGFVAGKFDLTTALAARSALIDVRIETIEAGLDARLVETEARALASAAPFDVTDCGGDLR